MIIKEDYRAKIEFVDGKIIKTFKEGSVLLEADGFDDDWKTHINNFARLYGHFPKIIEFHKNKLVMEQVKGKSFTEFRKQSYKLSLEEQIEYFKQMQFCYYKFICNLLEYNIKNKCSLVHNDLNYNNMYISNEDWRHGANMLLCIDLDAVKFNKTFVPNSFINFPTQVFQADAESLELQKNIQIQKELKNRLNKK